MSIPNKIIYLHSIHDDDNNLIGIDWSPNRLDPADLEYIFQFTVIRKLDRVMTAAWNFKNIHLAYHPEHKKSNFVLELEKAIQFADDLFPEENDLQWRK